MELWRDSIRAVLSENEKNVNFYENSVSSHEELIKNLETYNESLTVPILVPLCSRVLMRGNLVHTNEILTSLGCGYFVRSSSKRARELCERRIINAREALEKLERERDFLTNQIDFTSQNVFLPEGQEIVEPYDEDAEREWRKEHRVRLAAHKRSETESLNKIDDKELLDQLDILELEEDLESVEDAVDDATAVKKKLQRLRNREKVICVSEEDVLKRLDQLEEEEELETRLEILGGDTSSEEDPLSEEKEEISDSPVKKSPKNRRVSFAKEPEVTEETVTEETVTVHFKHSENPSIIVKESSDKIESPSDIYNLFPFDKSSKTKPIIKNCHKVKEETHIKEDDYSEDEIIRRPRITTPNVIGEIVEHQNDTSNIPVDNQNRKISKFKSMRLNKQAKNS